MTIPSEQLISELIEITRQNMNFAESLKQKSDLELTRRNDPASWNVLECIQHLNLYGEYYIPEITKKISSARTVPAPLFKSGWLGNYFAHSMLPKEKLNKMKTFKDKNPLNSQLDKNVIDVFLHQQVQLLHLLDKARKVNLNKVKIKISIAKWISLKLGDTFRFVIYHNIRHIKQIEKIINETGRGK